MNSYPAPKSEIDKAIAIAINYQKSGRFDDAENIYIKVLEVSPRNPDALHYYGVLCLQFGAGEKAVALIKKSLKKCDHNAVAHCNLGAAYRSLNRLSEAEKCYRTAIRIKPDYAEAYYNLGNTLNDLKQFREAKKDYLKALAIKPEYAQACCNLAVVLLELGLFRDAENYCRRALEILPEYAKAYYNLGNSLCCLDKKKRLSRHIRPQ